MRYGFYLFDLDGTLTDSMEGIKNAYQYALDEMGIEQELGDVARLIGPPIRENLSAFYGITGKQNERTVAKFREYFADKGIFENKVYPGIIETLKELKKRGAKTAVATSKVRDYAKRIAERFEFAAYFDYICGGEFDGSHSLKSEVITDVLNHFNAKPEQAVMIGDRKHDIIGAKQTGTHSIGVTWGYGRIAELQAAGADIIIDTPSEILM